MESQHHFLKVISKQTTWGGCGEAVLLRFYQWAHWSAPSLQNSLSLVGISGDTIRLKKYWYQTEKFLLDVNTRDRATVKMMANFLSIQCSGILQVLWVTQDMTNIMRNMPGVCRKHNWSECISGSGLFRFLWCINNREGKAKWKFRPMQALREVFQRAVFTSTLRLRKSQVTLKKMYSGHLKGLIYQATRLPCYSHY